MMNGKAAGKTGLTPEMLKVLPPAAMDCLTQVIRKNWEGELACDEWQIMELTMPYKYKTGDANNWRGICIK
jgi:hypothetical protein